MVNSKRITSRTMLTGTLSFVFACGGDLPERVAETVVRDSAGITIVESTKPVWTEESNWRLSQEPIVTMGSLDGPEEHQFYQLQAVLLQPDGAIVIADRGTNELRFFDSSGQVASELRFKAVASPILSPCRSSGRRR